MTIKETFALTQVRHDSHGENGGGIVRESRNTGENLGSSCVTDASEVGQPLRRLSPRKDGGRDQVSITAR